MSDAAIRAQLKKARDQLLALDLRNRLLNFRPTRRTTIQIVDELPDQVWQLLVRDEKAMEFLAQEEHNLFQGNGVAAEEDAGAHKGQEDEEEDEVFDLPKIEDLPRGAGERGEARYTDRFLQTGLSGPVLQTNLLRTFQASETAQQERGVNILFLSIGFLTWKETEDSPAVLKAPILLVPVGLERASARTRFKLKVLDDDPIINPCLVLKLQQHYRLQMPAVTDWETFEPEAYLNRVSQVVCRQRSWQVTPEIFLGLLSFAKYLMYVDLDEARWPKGRGLLDNGLIRAVCGEDCPDLRDLPDEAAEPRMFDDMLDPANVYQVVDADASQQKAILAAKKGASLVIEGPPGTGKSQTITNIIAECLSLGKKVLFVSEKMAALDVVKRRLDGVGLGDFCLELHSTKANKRAVAEELARVLSKGQASPPAPAAAQENAQQLQRLRSSLNAYVRALHEPIGNTSMTPYRAMGRVAQMELDGVPDLPCEVPGAEDWNRQDIDHHLGLVARLADCLRPVGYVEAHPWRGVRLTHMEYGKEAPAAETIEALASALKRVVESAAVLASHLGGAVPETLEGTQSVADAARLVLSSPGPARRLMEGNTWDEAGAEAAGLLEKLQRYADSRKWLDGRYEPGPVDTVDWREFHKLFGGYWRAGAVRFLMPRYWADRGLVKHTLAEGRRFQMPQILDEMRQLAEMQALEDEIEAMESSAKHCFDNAWRGPDTDFLKLVALGNWLAAFRRALQEKVIGGAAIDLACAGAARGQLEAAYGRQAADLGVWQAAWNSFRDFLSVQDPGLFEQELAKVPLDGLRRRIEQMRGRIETLYDWAQYQEALQSCEGTTLAPLLRCAQGKGVAAERLVDVTEKRLLRAWLDRALREREALRGFSGPSHESTARSFAELDHQWVGQTSARLQAFLASQRPNGKLDAARSSQLGILQGEIRRKRGLRPIRELLRDAGDVVQELKPCFMMSPLSVAQFVAPEGARFDVVVFDEASQVEPADALGAIARGQQLILVGDNKQLPPTPFFRSIGAWEEESSGQTGAAPLSDMESILDKGAAVFPKVQLKWHYRSRHESLIAFSNYRFYDNELLVFPSNQAPCDKLGLVLTYKLGDLYDRGKSQTNREQARRVADAVFEHARKYPDLSLGVGAFSQRQQQAILDEIERRLREDDSAQEFFRRDKAEPFFVKNLETIQGDERDVIFLSIGYGKAAPGERLNMGFGPLNLDGGWRRLNVLITRARRRCIVFSSIRGLDFDLSATQAKGVHALKEYLEYAEKGTLPVSRVGDGEFGSEFERAVYGALAARGIHMHRQVGCRGYAIDMAVIDPQEPGRYILGIECDGAMYHSCPTARDRDRLRQQVLEDLGWRIHRIWSTDWYRKPGQELERALGAIEKAKRGQYPARFAALRPGASAPAKASQPVSTTSGSGLGDVPGELPSFAKDYEYSKTERVLLSHGFYEERNDVLASMVTAIVQVEGPIHEEELARRVAGAYGLGRAGARIQGKVHVAVELAVKKGTIRRENEFLWLASMSVPPVRRRPYDAKDMNLVSLEEIGEAAWQLLKAQYGMVYEDLVIQVARLLGFQRTGERAEARIREAINREVQEGRIVTGPDGRLEAAER